MNLFILFLLFESTENQPLNKLRNFYQLPLLIEPSYIDKGDAYLNLSVIDIRLNNLDKALNEAKKAGYYDRKIEATYLEGVIYYIKGNNEKASSKFKELDQWEYTYFLENLYILSINKELSSKITRNLPDSLSFYYIFYEEDTSKILTQLEKATLPLWQNFLGRGYLSYKRNRYRRALNYFNESYKIHPKEYTGIYITATLFQLNEYDSLISFQAKNPINNPLINYIKGEVFYKRGETQRALELFLSDTNSEYKSHAIFAAGWSKYHLSRYSESAKLFKRFLEIYEDKELEQYALYRLARAQLKQGKIESLEYFKRIVEKYPDSPLKDDAYLLLGKINYLLNDYEEAVKWLSLFTKELPSSRWAPNAYKYLGQIYMKREEYDSALNYYKELLLLPWAPPDLYDEARYYIEEIKWKKGEYPTKISMYKAFTNKYPKSQRTPLLLLKIGEYYHAAKRYDLAIQYNNKILLNHPESEEANESLLILVKIYREMGDRKEAINLLEKGLQERPELKNEIYLKLGEIYYEAGELKKAIENYTEVSSKTLKDYTLYKIASIYQELGFFKEARIPLKNIIENFQGSEYLDEAYLLIAKTYMNEGSFKKAIEILDEGLKNLKKNETGPLLSFKAEIYCEFKDEESLDLYLESVQLTYDHQNKIKILENGRKCAIRLNRYDKAEMFEDLINEIRSSKE